MPWAKIVRCLRFVETLEKERLKLESVAVAKLTNLLATALAGLSGSSAPEFKHFLTDFSEQTKSKKPVLSLIKDLAKAGKLPAPVLNAFLPHL